MNRILLYLAIIILAISCKKEPALYFEGKKSETHYFGQTVVDPYSNLEHIEDSTVIDYIHRYNEYTNQTLETIVQNKEKLSQKLYDFENSKIATYKDIKYVAGNVVYLKRDKSENTFRLYYKNPSNNISETLLYDPANFEYQGKKGFLINYYQPNWDFSKIAISFTKDGNEFSKMIVWDVIHQNQISKTITYCAPTMVGGITWLPNNEDFLYIRVNDTTNTKESLQNTAGTLYQTTKDTKQQINIFSAKKNPNLGIQAKDFPLAGIFNNNVKYVIGRIAGATVYHDAYVTSVSSIKNPNWRPLYKKEDLIKNYLQDQDSLFYITAKNASNFRICKTSLIHPDFDNSKTLVQEKKDEVINQFAYKNGMLLYGTLKNGVEAKMYYLDQEGKEQKIELPYVAGKINFEHDPDPQLLPVIFGGWTLPKQRFIYDIEKKTFTKDVSYPSDVQTSFDDLIVEEVLVKGHDGEEIPLSLIYKKGLQKNGKNPVLMRAYGAYGVNSRPNFYYGFLLWAKEGGIYAVAHVRGGSEKGNQWYEQGKKLNKPNSWKDFISCTEFLIDQKFSGPENIAIWSGSAGGITLGRAMTERPDLYSAVILDRGLYNTITIDEKPNGANNTKEFGSNKDSIEFRGLYEMDTYHHVKDQVAYPATLLTVGMNDSRVPPSESFKLATRLRNATTSKKPILLRTEFDTGHGMTLDRKDKEFDIFSRVFSFALWQTGHPDYQPGE